MNGFEKHGLQHSSPSQINMWCDAPDAWAAKYIFQKPLPFGVPAQIGVLTEKVVADVLCGASFDEALEQAKKEFNKTNALNTNQKDRDRISDIGDMAKIALDVLKEYGEPEFIHKITGREQQRIEINCNGGDWSIPVIGFLDFVFPKHGLIIDLKTTSRCPSEMSAAHARQAAVYSKAKGNMRCEMLYVTPKKYAMYGIDDVGAVLSEIKAILTRQEAFLRCMSKEQIQAAVPVSMNSFYWTGAEATRKELYGV